MNREYINLQIWSGFCTAQLLNHEKSVYNQSADTTLTTMVGKALLEYDYHSRSLFVLEGNHVPMALL